MSETEGDSNPDYSQPPDGYIETWVAFPLGLEREADSEAFEHQIKALVALYGDEHVMPDFVVIEGVTYPGIKVFKPDDPVDRAISEAWGNIFFSD